MKLTASIVFCLCFLPVEAMASDAFEDLDAVLEAQFEQLDAELEAQFQALDQAIEVAFKRLETEVTAEWGADDVELPSKTQWVDYSEDKHLRRIIDFEKGVINIEHILNTGDDVSGIISSMQQAASTISTDTMEDLSKKDSVLLDVKAQLASQDIELEPFSFKATEPVLGGIVDRIPEAVQLEVMLNNALEGVKKTDGKIKARVSPLPHKQKKISLEIPLRFGFQTSFAARHQAAVLREAKRQALPPSLVFSIIESESSFNPRARSAVPAFGLMQLVPRSGAMDAYNYVYGEKLLLDPEYLYDAEQNVELGAAYLGLLFTRYLRHIENIQSRQFCMIAAYNTGAGNVARSFTGETNVRTASVMINKLTPEQVFDHLQANLPYDETKHYLTKVVKAQKKYASMDQ